MSLIPRSPRSRLIPRQPLPHLQLQSLRFPDPGPSCLQEVFPSALRLLESHTILLLPATLNVLLGQPWGGGACEKRRILGPNPDLLHNLCLVTSIQGDGWASPLTKSTVPCRGPQRSKEHPATATLLVSAGAWGQEGAS